MHDFKKGQLPFKHKDLLSDQYSKTLEDKKCMETVPYASKVGSLMYVMLCSGSDICIVVVGLCGAQFCLIRFNDPTRIILHGFLMGDLLRPIWPVQPIVEPCFVIRVFQYGGVAVLYIQREYYSCQVVLCILP